MSPAVRRGAMLSCARSTTPNRIAVVAPPATTTVRVCVCAATCSRRPGTGCSPGSRTPPAAALRLPTRQPATVRTSRRARTSRTARRGWARGPSPAGPGRALMERRGSHALRAWWIPAVRSSRRPPNRLNRLNQPNHLNQPIPESPIRPVEDPPPARSYSRSPHRRRS